jgi:phenylacetate-CoA ligase
LEPVSDVSPEPSLLAQWGEDLLAFQGYLRSLLQDASATEAYQQAQLAELLTTARQHSPYYRTQLASLTPEAIALDPVAALASCPPLTKRTVQQQLEAIWCENAVDDAVAVWMTSGSTGEPTRFIVDPWTRLVREISLWLIQQLLGNNCPDAPPDQTLMIRLSSTEGPDRWVSRMPLFGNGLLWKLPLYPHPSCPLPAVLEMIRQEQPPLLAGDPQAFITLIETWQERYGDATYPFPLKSLTCGGNQLSHPVRKRIEAFFQRPITDCYGLSETAIVASQCLQGAWHIHAPLNYVEITDSNGQPVPDGTVGEITVTNLVNFAFPFIRYRTGDLGCLLPAEAPPCPCGSPLTRLSGFEGRKRRFLVRADGSLLPPQTLVPLFVEQGFYQFQLIQHTPTQFTLRYLAATPMGESDQQALRTALSRHVGQPVTLTCNDEPGPSLAEPGVKFQDFISHCHESLL